MTEQLNLNEINTKNYSENEISEEIKSEIYTITKNIKELSQKLINNESNQYQIKLLNKTNEPGLNPGEKTYRGYIIKYFILTSFFRKNIPILDIHITYKNEKISLTAYYNNNHSTAEYTGENIIKEIKKELGLKISLYPSPILK